MQNKQLTDRSSPDRGQGRVGLLLPLFFCDLIIGALGLGCNHPKAFVDMIIAKQRIRSFFEESS